jgi:hypothetical protein
MRQFPMHIQFCNFNAMSGRTFQSCLAQYGPQTIKLNSAEQEPPNKNEIEVLQSLSPVLYQPPYSDSEGARRTARIAETSEHPEMNWFRLYQLTKAEKWIGRIDSV